MLLMSHRSAFWPTIKVLYSSQKGTSDLRFQRELHYNAALMIFANQIVQWMLMFSVLYLHVKTGGKSLIIPPISPLNREKVHRIPQNNDDNNENF